MNQVEIVSVNQLVPPRHRYRRFLELWNFKPVDAKLLTLRKSNPNEGYGLPVLFRCLLLQFLEDLSDRELEMMLQENIAAKLFCGFSLAQDTPDHTVFTRARNKIGTNMLSKLFQDMKDQLRAQGYMNEVFTFVDASHLIAKANLWKERDKLIAAQYEKMSNDNIEGVAHDKQARLGCKGKNKFWYGYKKHTSVDMQSGMVNKVAITPANVTDAQGMKHVCPNQGAAYADKGYCLEPSRKAAAKRGVHLAAIKKNNMKDKNKDLDRFYSQIRAPYERIFSKTRKRVRYVGVAKNQFAAFMEAMALNLKRWCVLDPLVSVGA